MHKQDVPIKSMTIIFVQVATKRESNRTKVICENQNIIVLGLDILYCYQVSFSA